MDVFFLTIILYLLSFFINVLLVELYFKSKETRKMMITAKQLGLLQPSCVAGFIVRVSPTPTGFNMVCLARDNKCIEAPSCSSAVISNIINDPTVSEYYCSPYAYGNANHGCNITMTNVLSRLRLSLNTQ